MAPPKKPWAALGRTAQYYRANPDKAKAKKAVDAEINRKPSQVKKRVEANKHRAQAKAMGVAVAGKDASHQPDGAMRMEDSSVNRGRRNEGGR